MPCEKRLPVWHARGEQRGPPATPVRGLCAADARKKRVPAAQRPRGERRKERGGAAEGRREGGEEGGLRRGGALRAERAGAARGPD